MGGTEATPPNRRGIAVLALLGLTVVTTASVAGLVWAVVMNNEGSSALVGIASMGVGGLAAAAGFQAAPNRRNGAQGNDSEGGGSK